MSARSCIGILVEKKRLQTPLLTLFSGPKLLSSETGGGKSCKSGQKHLQAFQRVRHGIKAD
jgi:hypothetical protein